MADFLTGVLIDAGLYLSVRAMLQKAIELLSQRMQDADLQQAALKALLAQRSAGAFVSSTQMDKTIAQMITEKRRAHAVQN